jgi:hypothetical protein
VCQEDNNLNIENVKHFISSLKEDINFDKGLQWKYTFTIIVICFGFITILSQKIVAASVTTKFISLVLLLLITICFLLLMVISHKTMKQNRKWLGKLFDFFLNYKGQNNKCTDLGSIINYKGYTKERQAFATIYFTIYLSASIISALITGYIIIFEIPTIP